MFIEGPRGISPGVGLLGGLGLLAFWGFALFSLARLSWERFPLFVSARICPASPSLSTTALHWTTIISGWQKAAMSYNISLSGLSYTRGRWVGLNWYLRRQEADSARHFKKGVDLFY